MKDMQLLTALLGLDHVRATSFEMVGSEQLKVVIEFTLEAAVCPECQQVSVHVHDVGKPQLIRDLSVCGRRCWLVYAPRRFKCGTCQDTFVERVAWREPGLTYTRRYEQQLYDRSRGEPITQIARDEDLSEDIVQGIFERAAKKHSPSGGIPRFRS